MFFLSQNFSQHKHFFEPKIFCQNFFGHFIFFTQKCQAQPQPQLQLSYAEIVLLSVELLVHKKYSLNLRNSFCLISLAKNMIEGWDVIHLTS